MTIRSASSWRAASATVGTIAPTATSRGALTSASRWIDATRRCS
jgi:hypothetical protein